MGGNTAEDESDQASGGQAPPPAPEKKDEKEDEDDSSSGGVDEGKPLCITCRSLFPLARGVHPFISCPALLGLCSPPSLWLSLEHLAFDVSSQALAWLSRSLLACTV